MTQPTGEFPRTQRAAPIVRDERSPLLADASAAAASTQSKPADRLPYGQIAVICFCRFTEPIAFLSLLPWIQNAIVDFGIAHSKAGVGYYAGAIESAFGISQLATGRLSDRIGRKPVITFGLVGATGATILFGFSKTLTTLVLSRLLQGLLAGGNAGVIKAALAELSTDQTKARAFASLPMSWAAGAAIGPLLGGYLSPEPAHPPLVPAYPYLVPNLAAAAFPLIGAILCHIGLRETIASKNPASVDSPNAKQVLPWRDLLTRRVMLMLATYGLLALHTIALAAMVPLFAFTPIADGGLGFSSRSIGTALAIYGFGGAGVQLFVYPPVHARLGTAKTFRVCAALYMVVYCIYPLISVIARTGDRTATWAALIVALAMSAIANMSYSSLFILVQDSAPTRTSLGAVNGLAQAVASAFRAIGPIAATSMFAFSVDRNVLDGKLIWVVLFMLALATCLVATRLDDRVAWREAELAEQKAPEPARGA